MEGPIKDIFYIACPGFRPPFWEGKHPNFSWWLLSSGPCNLGRNDSIPNSRVRPVRTVSPGSIGWFREKHMTPNRQRHWSPIPEAWLTPLGIYFLSAELAESAGRWQPSCPHQGTRPTEEGRAEGRRKWEQFLKASVQSGIQSFHKPVSPGLFSNMNQQITFLVQASLSWAL